MDVNDQRILNWNANGILDRKDQLQILLTEKKLISASFQKLTSQNNPTSD